MNWLAAWWRQVSGPPETNPWETDPHIREERRDQHARINRVASVILTTGAQAERERQGRFTESMREAWTGPKAEPDEGVPLC